MSKLLHRTAMQVFDSKGKRFYWCGEMMRYRVGCAVGCY